MKKLMLALGVLAALASGSAMAGELTLDSTGKTTPVSTGVWHHGKVAVSTCKYDAPIGRGFSKELGTYLQNEINTTYANDVGTPAVEYSFKFTDCPIAGTYGKTGLQMWVDDSLSNLIHDADKGLLANAAPPADVAQNVWVQILKGDATNNTVFKLGKNKEVYEQDFAQSGKTDDLEFKFAARLYSEGKALPGEVMGYAPFMVDYK